MFFRLILPIPHISAATDVGVAIVAIFVDYHNGETPFRKYVTIASSEQRANAHTHTDWVHTRLDEAIYHCSTVGFRGECNQQVFASCLARSSFAIRNAFSATETPSDSSFYVFSFIFAISSLSPVLSLCLRRYGEMRPIKIRAAGRQQRQTLAGASPAASALRTRQINGNRIIKLL